MNQSHLFELHMHVYGSAPTWSRSGRSSRFAASARLVDAQEHLQHIWLAALGKQRGVLTVDLCRDRQRSGSGKALEDGHRLGLLIEMPGRARAQHLWSAQRHAQRAAISRWNRAADAGAGRPRAPLVIVNKGAWRTHTTWPCCCAQHMSRTLQCFPSTQLLSSSAGVTVSRAGLLNMSEKARRTWNAGSIPFGCRPRPRPGAKPRPRPGSMG